MAGCHPSVVQEGCGSALGFGGKHLNPVQKSEKWDTYERTLQSLLLFCFPFHGEDEINGGPLVPLMVGGERDQDAVNCVGVDLNTASPALLEHVAGLNASRAQPFG